MSDTTEGIQPLLGYRRSIKHLLTNGNILGVHGVIYNLFDPKSIKINLEEMGVGLGRTPRYYGDTGHAILKNANNIYSVAQHIVTAVRAAIFFGDLELAWEMFVHDLPEHWLGDLKSPIKNLFGDKYKEIEESYLKEICEHYKVKYPLSGKHKILDTNMAEWETTVFMGGDCTIFEDFWTPEKAARELMNVYKELQTLTKLRDSQGLEYAADYSSEYKPTK